jgi:hypothetical protein
MAEEQPPSAPSAPLEPAQEIDAEGNAPIDIEGDSPAGESVSDVQSVASTMADASSTPIGTQTPATLSGTSTPAIREGIDETAHVSPPADGKPLKKGEERRKKRKESISLAEARRAPEKYVIGMVNTSAWALALFAFAPNYHTPYVHKTLKGTRSAYYAVACKDVKCAWAPVLLDTGEGLARC